jgi:hypothetical protein
MSPKLNGVDLGPRSPMLTTGGRKRYLGPSEHDIQATYVAAIRHKIALIPSLAFLHAIPNSVGASKATQGKRKAEGVVPGMPDIHWPVVRGPFVGLWIEFKRPGESVPGYQYHVHEALRLMGHCVLVLDDAQHAFDATLRYEELEDVFFDATTDDRRVAECRVRGW